MDVSPPVSNAGRRYGWAVVAGLLLLGAGVLFTQRGVMRAAGGSWDFTMIYAGARQLALGGNPYNFDATYDTYLAADGTDKPRDRKQFCSLYPPMTYAVLSPLGTLRWPTAKLAWLTINLIATAGIAAWLLRHRPARLDQHAGATPSANLFPGVGVGLFPGAAVVLALWLGGAAVHTTIAFGQLSLVTLALMLPLLSPARPSAEAESNAWGWLRGRTVGCGLMLALAGALKPQLMGIVALLMLLCSVRWRAVVWGMAGGVVVTLISVLWMQRVAPSWWADWQAELAYFAASGHAGPTSINPYTYQLIHLEPWLHRLWPGGIGPQPALGWFATAAVVVITLGVGLRLRRLSFGPADAASSPRPGDASPRDRYLLAMSLGVVLTLLVGYHRTYDAVLLVVPGLWVWRSLAVEPRRLGVWIAAGALALFLLPGPVMLTVAQRHGYVPLALTDSLLWRAVLLPHHTLALLVLLVVLARAFLRPRVARDAAS